MRLKYYLLTLRQMKIKRSFVLFVIIISIVFICILVCKKSLEPTIQKLCEEDAVVMARKTSNKAVLENIKDINYEDLVTIKQDGNARVNAIIANTTLMNKIINNVINTIDEEFKAYEENYINIPVSSFFGINFFAGSSIKMKTKTILVGNVTCDIKSTFESVGINQTKHRIYFEVKTITETIAPLFCKTQEYTNTIMIAETVIVGEIPQTYYNLEGIENFNNKDSLDITN